MDVSESLVESPFEIQAAAAGRSPATSLAGVPSPVPFSAVPHGSPLPSATMARSLAPPPSAPPPPTLRLQYLVGTLFLWTKSTPLDCHPTLKNTRSSLALPPD